MLVSEMMLPEIKPCWKRGHNFRDKLIIVGNTLHEMFNLEIFTYILAKNNYFTQIEQSSWNSVLRKGSNDKSTEVL